VTTKKEVIETELQRVWDERSRLTPEDVLEVASDKASPLHPFFEWEDGEAARQYRLAQAAGLIRSVKISFTVERNGEVEDIKVRRWLAPRAAGAEIETQPGYQPEDVVRQTPELRNAVLRQMKRDINNMRRRYAHLDEFWVAMDEAMLERVEAAG
jgi:hypothetical protein